MQRDLHIYRGLLLIIILFWNLFCSAQFVESFNENEKWGFKTQNGELLIAPKYDYVWDFQSGLALVNIGGEYGFDGGIYGGKFGYVDSLGKEIIEAKYEVLSFFHEGLAFAAINGKYGFINKRGEVIIPFEYDWASTFKDGIAKVNIGIKWSGSGGQDITESPGKYGYINTSGKVVISIKYDSVGEFSTEGIAWASLNGKYGYINSKGEEIIPFMYDSAYDFESGIATVILGDRQFQIDMSGAEIKN